ncbi:MAG: DUF2975 domain-containing protein [Firmicutes bacterium]|nr:DUF2975 domain-containing protein [Bacillota bacterium]
MKWTKDKSIKLSIACVFVFAAILLALDIWTVWGWIAPDFELRTQLQWQYYVMFTATVASGSICAWICLWALYRLLKNIQAGRVFTEDTVKLLRTISWCCAGAAAVCLLSAAYAWPFLVVAIAAAFMMLIVRIVKNCFRQAIDMKTELDLTI